MMQCTVGCNTNRELQVSITTLEDFSNREILLEAEDYYNVVRIMRLTKKNLLMHNQTKKYKLLP